MDFELSNQPDHLLLAKLCTIIIEKFNGKLLSKIADFDSVYIDFEIENFLITLHQQTFIGIILFPTNLKESMPEEILFVKKLGQNLLKYT